MKLFGKEIQLQDKRRIDERTKVEKICLCVVSGKFLRDSFDVVGLSAF
jgi:hypothetical protein